MRQVRGLVHVCRRIEAVLHTLTLSAARSTFEFAPEAEAVLRPLIDGRTVDLAALADTAGLALEDVVGLVQELVAGQAATVGSLL
ncbi:winged helix domain-containing protein [Streptomyces sp. AM6-12]|uniref:winged helix domain-containing protein n=1 Tax=Streptomyces sp. AM6-12 TaxID=3345149 RepID=UPI0037A73394